MTQATIYVFRLVQSFGDSHYRMRSLENSGKVCVAHYLNLPTSGAAKAELRGEKRPRHSKPECEIEHKPRTVYKVF